MPGELTSTFFPSHEIHGIDESYLRLIHELAPKAARRILWQELARRSAEDERIHAALVLPDDIEWRV